MIKSVQNISPFPYKTAPFDHQRDEFEKTRTWEYYALFWEMGTGKSKPIVDTMAYLYLTQEIDGVLIISDKGAYLNWEREEIPKHMPDCVSHKVAHWASVLRKAEQLDLEDVMIARDDRLDILCMNVEALSTGRALTAAKAFLQNHWSMLVVDESTSIKSPDAKRTRNVTDLTSLAQYRRILTGTPITQDPMDLYSQCHFLKPGLLGYTNFFSFRAHYAEMRQVVLGNRTFRQITGFKNLGELTTRLTTFSSRYMKDQCLDLPEKLYEILHVDMSPEQRQVYDQVKNEAMALLEQGLLTVTNALSSVEKLHQICCGHVKLDDGTTVNLPNERLVTLEQLLQTLGRKAIIWCVYQRDIENVLSMIREKFRDIYAVDYYGKTSTDARLYALDKFAHDPDCRFFVGSPGAGGKGLTLVSAHYVVYYSCGWRLEHRLQSEDRAHRIGQINSVTYVDMVCPGTVDEKIIRALRQKQDIAREVLNPDNFRAIIE